ncbi:hypothetical protein K438DRAFT_1765780 [Mycena galopus ATCC 62051]|nr:hypothetical protein K438DRAFT_1765780 [Mycena galopus ATCC 62051]
MSDDESYHSSHATTLGLDYEQSQAHHEIRVLREAELTEEERNAGALCRHRKRQRLGHSPPTSPKQESEDHDEMVRSTAQEARHAISDLYGPFGFLNSQVGESTYIDHILNVPTDLGPKSEPQSQEVGFLDPPQDPESDKDSDHELPVQVVRLKNRLNIALQERDDLEDQCNQYQQAYLQADAEQSQLREQLQKWEQAATAASALTKKHLRLEAIAEGAIGHLELVRDRRNIRLFHYGQDTASLHVFFFKIFRKVGAPGRVDVRHVSEDQKEARVAFGFHVIAPKLA